MFVTGISGRLSRVSTTIQQLCLRLNCNTHTHTHTYIYIYTHIYRMIKKSNIYIFIHTHTHTHTHTHRVIQKIATYVYIYIYRMTQKRQHFYIERSRKIATNIYRVIKKNCNIYIYIHDFNIGGQIIQTVKYADDLVLMAKEETVLQGMLIN